MSYLGNITVPVLFEADSDDQARLIMEHLREVFAHISLPHEAEIIDVPEISLGEVLKYQEPRTIYAGDADFMVRMAPVESGSAGACEACQETEAELNQVRV